MDHLTGNLAALSLGAPYLLDDVRNAALPAGAEFQPTRDGDCTLRLPKPGGGTTTLHSKYDPRGEAAKTVGEVDPKAVQAWMVLGFGLGYHLQELCARANAETEIIVVEKHPELIRAAAERRDLRALFSDRRVAWVVGRSRQDLYQILRIRHQSLTTAAIKMLEHHPSTALDPEYYAAATEAIRDFIVSGEKMLITNFVAGRKSAANQMANLPLYTGCPSLADLRPLYAGRPGIVVSAGPSLRRNIKGLQAARGRAVLVACDVVLKPLLEQGIVPDFTAIVDYQGQTRKFFETLPAEVDTRLVAIAGAFPDTVRKYPGPLAFVGDQLLDVLLGDAARDMGGYHAGGNVGHFCYVIACHLGLEPIAFVGQDLSFPLNITHLPGTPIHEEWQNERNRFYTLEMRELEDLLRRRRELRQVPAQDGGEVFTEKNMYHYLRDLETAIANSGRRTVDCTEGGSLKEGTEVMPLAEFLSSSVGSVGSDGSWPLPGAGPREPDRGRLAAVVKALDRYLLDFLEVKAVIEQKLRAHKRIEKALAESEPVERYLRTIGELELRAQKHQAVMAWVQTLSAQDYFVADKADRKVRAEGLDGDVKLRAQFARDDKLVKGLLDGLEFFEPLLRDARRRCAELAGVRP